MCSASRISQLIFNLIIAASVVCEAAASESTRHGEQYSPPGLYEPEVYQLGNGLKVVLKTREHIHGVSIRAVVNVGSAHYPCGRQQIPHFLEHMLFAAHPDLSESEFEQMMFNMGAKSNAVTEDRQTVYQFSVYSPNALMVLEALSKILFDGQLTENSFQLTKDIIRRESGGAPNYYVRWLEKTNQKTSAGTFAIRDISPDQFGVCPGIDIGSEVTIAQVQDAYSTYYGLKNVTLIMVGDFTLNEGKNWIQTAFGAYEAKTERPPQGFDKTGILKKARYKGVADEPGAGIIAKTEGYLSKDFYALNLLQHYLENQMYHRLRIETGLTYTPSVDYHVLPDVGLFYIYATLSNGSQKAALEIIGDELGTLMDVGLNADVFESARTSLLFSWAKSTETNDAFADYYANSLPELAEYGRFRNEEVAVAALTPSDLQRVAHKLFADGNHAELFDTSFNDKIQTAIIAILCSILLMIAVIFIAIVRHKRIQRIEKCVGDSW